MVGAAVESGERLYPSTAAHGRDAVRHALRSLRAARDALYDRAAAASRALELSAVQRATCEDSARQLDDWLAAMETQISGAERDLAATLDDKKARLHTYRVSV